MAVPTLGETEVRQGRITRIDPVSLEGDHQLGLGAIIGGIAGGVLGIRSAAAPARPWRR
jgi:outer membrane lipoprotein SlyB